MHDLPHVHRGAYQPRCESWYGALQEHASLPTARVQVHARESNWLSLGNSSPLGVELMSVGFFLLVAGCWHSTRGVTAR